MSKSITQACQKKSMETENKAASKVFKCQQITDLKAPECSGYGYPTQPNQVVCGHCLTYFKKSVQFIAGKAL